MKPHVFPPPSLAQRGSCGLGAPAPPFAPSSIRPLRWSHFLLSLDQPWVFTPPYTCRAGPAWFFSLPRCMPSFSPVYYTPSSSNTLNAILSPKPFSTTPWNQHRVGLFTRHSHSLHFACLCKCLLRSWLYPPSCPQPSSMPHTEQGLGALGSL